MEGVSVAAQLNNPKTVRAWYMYDWANSVYSLVITTAIFPIYYKAVAQNNGSDVVQFMGVSIQNSVLYSYALSFSFLVVAVILPLLSGAADYTGNKKNIHEVFRVAGKSFVYGTIFLRRYTYTRVGHCMFYTGQYRIFWKSCFLQCILAGDCYAR